MVKTFLSPGLRRMMGTNTTPRIPIITIIGATGTGKSQLAVELALKFNGEIINCDAVQMYKGLPIITNKITLAEQRDISHHLLGSIELDQPPWTVSQFVPRARELIDEIRARGKLPVLVGGTHYYIQSLLVNEAILESGQQSERQHCLPILEEPTDLLLQRLQELDPVMAARWHPNERRKIQRSLEICLSTGRRASDIYAEQRISKQEQSADVNQSDLQHAWREPLKMPYDPLVLWIYAAKNILDTRLDERVHKMLQAGLLNEVHAMNNLKCQMESRNMQVDTSRGVWVSIGFKEFSGLMTSDKFANNRDCLSNLEADAILRTQAATRRYAKRQCRWIQYKLINAMIRNGAGQNLFILDGSDIHQWAENVSGPAQSLTTLFLHGQVLPDPQSLCDVAAEMLVPKRQDVSHTRDVWKKETCQLCHVTAITIEDWEKHVSSNRHKKALAASIRRRTLDSRGT